MPKMMIEVDIPTGRSVEEAKFAVRRAFDPDWMGEWWHIDDIIEQAENQGEQLSEDEARWILRMMDKYHDCNVGHTWESIDRWIDIAVSEREEV